MNELIPDKETYQTNKRRMTWACLAGVRTMLLGLWDIGLFQTKEVHELQFV